MPNVKTFQPLDVEDQINRSGPLKSLNTAFVCERGKRELETDYSFVMRSSPHKLCCAIDYPRPALATLRLSFKDIAKPRGSDIVNSIRAVKGRNSLNCEYGPFPRPIE